ncbi:hypothetical protein SDC9_26442 [bioreactor metagenome]|uniref:Uncharacterized protein n=1 Tax=bioreactor metagenome TaxID=1076179 RepID=A0A644UNP7_9ZZZZ
MSKLLADVHEAHQRADDQKDDRQKHDRGGGGGGILQQRDVIRDQPPDVRGLRTRHEPHGNEIAHHQRQHEDRADHDPGLRERDDDMGQDLHPRGAVVARRLDQAAVDAHHRVEDGRDHEQRVQMYESQHHREIGVKQPLDRRIDDAEAHQRLVRQPVAPEEGNPGDHPDDVRGQKGNGAQQKQHHPRRLGPDVEGEVIGHGEADAERQPPDQRGIDEGLEEHLIGHRRGQQELVVLKAEGRDDREFRGLPEAHDEDGEDRQHQKARQHRGERRGQKPALQIA